MNKNKKKKKLELNYLGGYRQASKYLTRKHGSSFSIIIDALVYIYNENLDKLVKVGDSHAVKISNGFLSRQTGLGLSAIKGNLKKIENSGLVTVLNMGSSNTRHYIIHVERINKYIEALEQEFIDWFAKSIETSKKDKSRFEEADRIKLKKSEEDFEGIMEIIKPKSIKPINGLVVNLPTESNDIDHPKEVKPTVKQTEEDTAIETTTGTNSVVVDEVFKKEDKNGAFTIIDKFSKKVYKQQYDEWMSKYTSEEREKIFRRIEGQEIENSLIIDDDYLNEEVRMDEDDSIDQDNVTTKEITEEEVMREISKMLEKIKRDKEKKRKTNKIAASIEISDSNWSELKNAYDDLPPIHNQGKFLPSKFDKVNFRTLTEYQQECVIKRIKAGKLATTTTSRPAIYIEDAMKGKLKERKLKNEGRLQVAL